MRQEINLYQPVFKRERRVLSALALVQALAAVLFGLGALYAYAAWQVAELAGEVEGLAGHRHAAEQRLVSLGTSLPARTPSTVLAGELARLDCELRGRREVAGALAERVAGAAGGFSAFFEGLARQRVEGLWITRVQIAAAGRQVTISGSALQPELVAVLVQRLTAEPAFEGLGFRQLAIDRSADDGQRVDFTVSTRALAPAPS